ncbi:hypothetical protein GCM10009867_07610 [Pedococcus aerophilus]|uniref:Cell division protein FtsL n=1 Tax=Pedococcus aerophilus TaxID=436356 RepID=A0ABN3UGC0_9MICO
MSQQTATARVASRAPLRRTAPPQPLRVVPAAIGQPGNGVFATLCMALLGAGLVALLMLNTAMAEGSFTLHNLQATSGELTDTQDALTQAIDAQRSPANLAARAAKLGMVPADSAAFLRLSDGKVLGVASPAKKQDGFTVVTAPQATSASSAAKKDTGPKATVSTKGDVTTTTVKVTKPDGSVVTTVTSVDAKTKATTSTSTTTPAKTTATPATQATTTPTPATPQP